MVFVYWDNSNIYHEAQRLADEREGTPGARHLVTSPHRRRERRRETHRCGDRAAEPTLAE